MMPITNGLHQIHNIRSLVTMISYFPPESPSSCHMFRTFTITLFILIGSPSAAAQQSSNFLPGYVVVSGDTLRGEVQDRIDLENTRSVVFRGAGEAPVTYMPWEAEAYGFEQGRRFERKTLAPGPEAEAEALFLQVLVEGEVSLYAFSLPSPQAFGSISDADRIDPIRYAIERAGTATPLYVRRRWGASTFEPISVDRQYVRALSEAFAECPTETRSLGRLRFTRRDLARAVTRFNACIGAEATVASTEGLARRSDVSAHFTMRVGGGASTVAYRGDNTQHFDLPRYRVLVEGVMDVRLRALGDAYSLPMTLGLHHTGMASGDPGLPRYLPAGDFERHRLAFGAGGRYQIRTGRVSPSVSVGATVAHLFGSDAFSPYPVRRMAWEAGWFAEVGGDVRPPRHVGGVGLALRYEATGLGPPNPFAARSQPDWRVSSLYGLIGVRF
jgi:hypothetical protein